MEEKGLTPLNTLGCDEYFSKVLKCNILSVMNKTLTHDLLRGNNGDPQWYLVVLRLQVVELKLSYYVF